MINAFNNIFLVHGGPGAVGSMHFMYERMAGRYNVTECLQTKYSISCLKQELLKQIQFYTSRPVTLIGHSWGAWLSILFAAEHYVMVSKLILIGCPPLEEKYVPLLMNNRIRILDKENQQAFMNIISLQGNRMTDKMITE